MEEEKRLSELYTSYCLLFLMIPSGEDFLPQWGPHWGKLGEGCRPPWVPHVPRVQIAVKSSVVRKNFENFFLERVAWRERRIPYFLQ